MMADRPTGVFSNRNSLAVLWMHLGWHPSVLLKLQRFTHQLHI